MGPARVPCAGGIVFDGRRRLLLIRRGRPPSRGMWSVPGGRCRPGESADAACLREVGEETGLVVQVLHHVGRVERDGPRGVVYEIDDFLCAVPDDLSEADPRAGDDALDARWVTRVELESLALAPLLYSTLSRWQCLPD